jgi:NitT/TauT family transport system substrate-binding protein
MVSIRAAVAPVVKPLTEATRLETRRRSSKEEASMHIGQSRRDFLATLSAAGAASVLGARASLADEGPPERTTIRLRREPGTVKLVGGGVDDPICAAPLYITEDLLRAEGFTDVRYVTVEGGPVYSQAFERGEIDFGLMAGPGIVLRRDAGVPITVLAGVHPGCFELFVHDQIRTFTDLKGKQVGIDDTPGSTQHQFVSFMAANAGLDPKKDIRWVTTDEAADPMGLFVQGKIDAFLAFMPQPQQLRERKIGRVVVDLAMDEPWSKNFCCMAVGNADFVRDNPIATKRALRAIMKATDVCAAERERAARQLVDGGFAQNYDYALQVVTGMRYNAWRELNPEESLRFYAQWLQKFGQLKSAPDAIIADSADWRFLNELKRELKA